MKHIFSLIISLLFLTACSTTKAQKETTLSTVKQTEAKHVLVFTKTLGWRHKSIETGVETIRAFGKKHNFIVTHTEDSLHFNNEFLPKYDAIVFLSTTGNVLDEKGQAAFEKYIQGGGSFMGVHAAADTEYDWPWYGKLVGGYFESHPNNPNIREAVLKTVQAPHPATKHLPASFKRSDEWYNYKEMNHQVTPLLLLDESSYEGGNQGKSHPIAWYHFYDGGRAFYTGGGHTKESFSEPDFRKHLENALLWCMQ